MIRGLVYHGELRATGILRADALPPRERATFQVGLDLVALETIDAIETATFTTSLTLTAAEDFGFVESATFTANLTVSATETVSANLTESATFDISLALAATETITKNVNASAASNASIAVDPLPVVVTATSVSQNVSLTASTAGGIAVDPLAVTVTATTVVAGGKAPNQLAVAPFLWLDANDTATMTRALGGTAISGSEVVTWNDKSGNNRHFENLAAESTDIVYSSESMNAKPGVSFLDTANGFMDTAGTMSLGANNFTIVWVGRYTGVTGEHSYLLSKQNANLGVYCAAERFSGDGLGWLGVTNGTFQHNGFGTGLASANAIYTWDLDSGGNYRAYNGTTQIGATVSVVSFSTAVDELIIGGNALSDFVISELIVYNTKLSAADFADLVLHLQNKWGL